MSFYTNAIKTELIDPVIHIDNRRSEFRLVKDNLYLSNLRICNLGLRTTVGNDKYNILTGALGIIKRIELLDGSTQLDVIEAFNILQAFRNYNKTNDENLSLNNNLVNNSLGFRYKSVDGTLATSHITNTEAKGISTNYDESGQAWVNLLQLFPMLKNMKYVHCGIFKDFRIVIEYIDDVKEAIQGDTSVVTLRPFLVADNVMNENLAMEIKKNFKGLVYMSMEHELIIIPQRTDAGEQKIVQKLQGFNKKRLNRMLFVKTPTESANTLKLAGSVAMHNDKFNIRINGDEKFARDGIIGYNERLALLSQTYGDCNSSSFSNVPTSNDTDANIKPYKTNTEPLTLVGKLDYFGLDMAGEKVGVVELVYSRTIVAGVAGPNIVQQINMNCFAECVKQLVMVGDDYVIQYL